MNLLNVITPINIDEEKIKFFASNTYNPVFNYEWEIIPLEEIKGSKKGIAIAVISQNHSAIVLEATKYFDTEVNAETLHKAKQIVSTRPDKTIPRKDVEDIVKQFEQAFSYFKLDYNLIVSDKTGFNFRPDPRKKKIVIGHSASFENFSLDGEVLHEMLHVVRFENGRHNEVRRNPYYLATEEGLACYLQDTHGEHGDLSIYQHAAEYAATAISLTGSLRDVIEYFMSIGFGAELAWQRAIRHKFGFKDTSLPGDIMKPAMYFCHENKIVDLSADEILKLFVGKIAISDLPNIEKYSGKFSKQQIQDFFRLE